MSAKCEKIDHLIHEFEEAGVQFERMSDWDLQKMREISDQKKCIIWLANHVRLKSRFLNESGRQYFDMDHEELKNFSLGSLMEITHPEDYHNYKDSVQHFANDPHETNTMCVRMKNHNEEWKWVYFVQKALNFDTSGLPEIMLAMLIDIEELIRQQSFSNTGVAYIEKLELYESLTTREKQVLDLVAEELTSQEIADQLFIETSTVDTHRKNILRKLKVKSSLGLVEYSLFYSDPSAKLRRVL